MIIIHIGDIKNRHRRLLSDSVAPVGFQPRTLWAQRAALLQDLRPIQEGIAGGAPVNDDAFEPLPKRRVAKNKVDIT